MSTHLREVLCHCALFLLVFSCLASEALAQPFIGNVNRWKAQDALDLPTPGSILFTGSSSIRRWEQLAFDFADYHVIQRGFGGSQFEDLNGYVNDIVLPYHPSAIVVWEGTNDIKSGESPAEVLGDYQSFINLVHAAQPDVDIFFLGIMPTPGRFACCETNNTTLNSSIQMLASGNSKLHYVDLPSAFNLLNPPSDGAFTSVFDDSIHLNRDGYDIWTSVIRPQVEAIVPPNKVFTLNPDTPQPGSRILFDFGPSNSQDGAQTVGADANGNLWNNWHDAEGGTVAIAGEHLGNLVDTTGAPTGIDLTITAGFNTNGKVHGGLFQPDGELLGDFAVETATQDFFFSTGDKKKFNGNDEVGAGFVLSGLDPGLEYSFKFFGSRFAAQIRETEYLLTGANSKAATLQTSGNNSRIATVEGIRPDGFGQVFFDMTLVTGDFAYLNAMEITVSVPEPSTTTSAGLATLGICIASSFKASRWR